MILSNVVEVFEDFAYHREWVDGNNWSLEFSARVGEFSLKGIDLIRLNDAGLIVEFEVFIRPANALQALGEAMAQRLQQVITDTDSDDRRYRQSQYRCILLVAQSAAPSGSANDAAFSLSSRAHPVRAMRQSSHTIGSSEKNHKA